MLCLYVNILFAYFISNTISFNFTSSGIEYIPTKKEIVETDKLSYEKRSRDQSQNVTLKFYLMDQVDVVEKKVSLSVNNELKNVEILQASQTPSKSQKIFIVKETINKSILYTLHFSKLEYAITGKYTLSLTIGDNQISATSYIYSQPIVSKFSKAKLGLEGDPMRITCNYESYPNATEIRWEQLSNLDADKQGNISFTNSTIIYPNDRIKISRSRDFQKENDTLFITSLLKNDSGLYRCIVISTLGEDSSVIRINVKDRWGALYPFIGIVIEVILLVTAILAYEKYQIRSQNKKKYTENIDEENKEPGIPLASGGGDDENIQTDTDMPPTVEVDVDKTNNTDNVKQRDTVTTKNV